MAHGDDMALDSEGWQTQRTRKSRRQKAWLAEPDAGGGSRKPAQSGGRRQLPDWLRRDGAPPPGRTGGKSGGKQAKGQAAGMARPWPFQGGTTKPKQGEQVPCCNPNCPGVGGRQSYKPVHGIGKGQYPWRCMACNMSWKKSWHIHFNGRTPPAVGQKGRRRWVDAEDEEEDEWEDDEPSNDSPAFEALPELYKGILKQIFALPDEGARQEAMDRYKNHDDPAIGKAMLAAYTETMATRQAAQRPVLRHPAGELASGLDSIRKERNKAEQLDRQAGAQLQRTSLAMLAVQERMAKDQKELLLLQKRHAEETAIKEETSKEAALKDQQYQAAMAHRERELLQAAGAQTMPLVPETLLGPGPKDDQAMLLQMAAEAVCKLGKYEGANIKPVLEALAKIIAPPQAAGEPAGKAPPTPPSAGSDLPTPSPELNEVSMAEGKRKPEDDADKMDDAEAMAAASLLGGEASASTKGKKTRFANKALLAQSQADVDDIMRLVNKNLRRPEDAASSSTGQQQG